MPAPSKPFTVPKHLGCMVKMIFGFGVMLLMGYFALMALNPKARKWATQGAKDGSGGPTPFKAMNQVLAIPAQAMGKTDDVVKANNARVGQLDGLIAEEEKKGKPGANRTPVVDPFATPAAATTAKKPGAGSGTNTTEEGAPNTISREAILALAEKSAAERRTPVEPLPARAKVDIAPVPEAPDSLSLPRDIVIAQASPAGAPRASRAFFYWVVNLNVGGITQGKPARLLINNRLAYEGDEVNRGLGIVFAQLDTANKLVIFRDASGAVVTRSY